MMITELVKAVWFGFVTRDAARNAICLHVPEPEY